MSLKYLYYRFIGFSGGSDIILPFSAKNKKVQFKCQSFIWGKSRGHLFLPNYSEKCLLHVSQS